MKTYIALDPGKSGGMACLHPEYIEIVPTPTIGDEISIWGIEEWLTSQIARTPRENIIVGIEDVHSIYGTSAVSNFEFGRALGILEGCVAGMQLPFIKVAPKTWQKVAWLGIPEMRKPGKDGKKGTVDTKEMSLLAAKRHFPQVNFLATEKSKKPHDGMVDAILIADYLRITNR